VATRYSPALIRHADRVMRGLPRDFRHFLERVSPTWNWSWRHLAYLQHQLDRVTDGEIKRLMIQMPPRHGKSETATIRYPIYRLNMDPELRVVVGAYNATLASKFSRKARRLAAHTGIALSDDRTAVDDWETAAGGGMRAVGVGGGITGQGGDLIVIDDPVKSREEAESEVYREKVWNWYTDDLYTRLEPGGAMILIMTRWHMDDLAGRILASEGAAKWTVVNLPALALENDPLGRAFGEALCPDRYDEEALLAIKTDGGMSEYAFAALYQQDPRPRDGNMFPRAKVEIVDAVPADLKLRVRYWDKGGGPTGDPTAGVKMATNAERTVFYIEDVVHARVTIDDRNKLMRQTAEMDGRSVRGWVEQEPGSGGKESAQLTVRGMSGFPYFAEPVSGDKVERADPLAAQWQAGNVKMVRARWNKAYLDEMEAFPSGVHDDQVDASSGAFNKLSLSRSTQWWLGPLERQTTKGANT
jgi:predicted phage terminase large subunit-like protein